MLKFVQGVRVRNENFPAFFIFSTLMASLRHQMVSSAQLVKCHITMVSSLRGGSKCVRSSSDGVLCAAHHLHHAILSLLHREGGPRVRESRHLQTGQTCDGRSEGPGGLLCHTVP